MSLPKKVIELESAAGCYTAELFKKLPDNLASVIFCSPISFRDPDQDNIWHPYLLNKGILSFVIDQAKPFARAVLSGGLAFARNKFCGSVIIRKKESSVLAIGPELICEIVDDRIKTDYLLSGDVNAVTWFITRKKRSVQIMSRYMILRYLTRFLIAWFKVTFLQEQGKYNTICSVLSLRWILSLVWVEQLGYYQKIEKTIIEVRPKLIFCVHEMHPLSRLLWIIAKKVDIKTVTVQHAIITREKLWYYATSYEKEVGLMYPDVFSVYSEKVVEELEEYVTDNTKFELVCGPRYSKWKNIKYINKTIGNDILLVGSLAWWDNETIFGFLESILDIDNFPYTINIRLHPSAIISYNRKRWVEHLVDSHIIINRRESLENDLANASLVVGCSSSVLYEAYMLGCNVLAINNSNYLYSVAPKNVINMPANVISKDYILDMMKGTKVISGVCGSIFGVENQNFSLSSYEG